MGMGVYLCMVPFILVLNFLHGFNGQFLMLYISGSLPCFMALFQGYLPLYSPLLDAFSTCGQASTLDFRKPIRFLLSQRPLLCYEELQLYHLHPGANKVSYGVKNALTKHQCQ
jgi:hypothetical protein